jgi:hypothetical protein
MADDARIGAGADCQHHGIDEYRFARTGFAGEGSEACREFSFGRTRP